MVAEADEADEEALPDFEEGKIDIEKDDIVLDLGLAPRELLEGSTELVALAAAAAELVSLVNIVI